ncbi:MAG TPA: 7-cyano-7-deazaguanine synthase QueC [Candidatus Scybalomonas excrementigallinarum]|nr:7-cyano-7-deazaguanine synthase QueC [Candidatus Scybalomonas excrementigallinarum]
MRQEKAMVLFSGGVDSTTCLALAIEQFGKENVIPLSISYGQKHEKEIESAKKILEYYQIEGKTMDLTSIFSGSNCSLLKSSTEDIPESSYEEQLNGKEEPVSTYVPFRNGLFLSTAAAIALSEGCRWIYYGAHKDDAVGSAYPDCSEAFFNAMNEAIYEGSGKMVQLKAPFIQKNKADIVKEGLRLEVPYELTWSCYEGKEEPCGKCGTCIDRQKAFLANGVTDPLLR